MRVAAHGDPYGVTGKDTDYRNRSVNAPSFAPPRSGRREAPGWSRLLTSPVGEVPSAARRKGLRGGGKRFAASPHSYISHPPAPRPRRGGYRV